MDENYPVVAVRLNVFAGQISAGANIASWCFALNGHLHYSTSTHEQELLRYLKISGCLDYALAPERNRLKPVILSNALGMVWAADYVWEEGKERGKGEPDYVVIIGPVFSSFSTMQTVEEHLLRMRLSQQAMAGMRQILRQIPVMTMTNFRQYVAMLHFTNTAELMNREDLEYQQPARPENDETRESFSWERAQEQEEAIFQSIRDGTVRANGVVDEMAQIPMPQTDGMLNDTQLREAKNMLIAHAALCARAAIAGGLPAQTARELELSYRRKIEKSTLVSHLAEISKEIRRDYAARVGRAKAQTGISVPVKVCCDYVDAHLREDIQLSDLARVAGYSEYYLTKKFHNEMGMRLSDYIRNRRIEYAKILLLTTNRTIDDICDMMGFGSRSHFTRVFTQAVGRSPGSFRTQSQHQTGGKMNDETEK